MAFCKNCNKKYFNYDNDAGTYLEMFCSTKCETQFENLQNCRHADSILAQSIQKTMKFTGLKIAGD